MTEITNFFTNRSYSSIVGNDTHLHCGICNQLKIYYNRHKTFNNDIVLVCGTGCALTYFNIIEKYNCKDKHSGIKKISEDEIFDYKCPTCNQFFTESEYQKIKDKKYNVLDRYS